MWRRVDGDDDSVFQATRNGVRLGDLRNPEKFAEQLRALAADAAARFDDFEYDVDAEIEAYKKYAERILPFIVDTVTLVNEQHKAGKRVLVEGANATMLDLDFGTYPFVTSSNPSLGGVCSGLGLAPNKFETVIGVAKAYTTRVGAGPYPTELFGDLADDLREKGFEYGTTTGRPRRIGWLDMVALNYASTINGHGGVKSSSPLRYHSVPLNSTLVLNPIVYGYLPSPPHSPPPQVEKAALTRRRKQFQPASHLRPDA